MSYQSLFEEKAQDLLLQAIESGAFEASLRQAYDRGTITNQQFSQSLDILAEPLMSLPPKIVTAGPEYIGISYHIYEQESDTIFLNDFLESSSTYRTERIKEELPYLILPIAAAKIYKSVGAENLDTRDHYDLVRSIYNHLGISDAIPTLTSIKSNIISTAIETGLSPLPANEWSATGVGEIKELINDDLFVAGDNLVATTRGPFLNYWAVYSKEGRLINANQGNQRTTATELVDENTLISSYQSSINDQTALTIKMESLDGLALLSKDVIKINTSQDGYARLGGNSFSSNNEEILLYGNYVPSKGSLMFDEFDVTAYANRDDSPYTNGYSDRSNVYLALLDKKTLDVKFAANVGGYFNDYVSPNSADIFEDGSSVLFVYSKRPTGATDFMEKADNFELISKDSGYNRIGNLLYFNDTGELTRQIETRTGFMNSTCSGPLCGSNEGFLLTDGLADISLETLSDNSVMMALSVTGVQTIGNFTIHSQTKGINPSRPRYKDLNTDVSNLALLKLNEDGSVAWSAQSIESGNDEINGRVNISQARTLSDGSTIVAGNFFGSHNFGETTLTSTYDPFYENRGIPLDQVINYSHLRDSFLTLIDSEGNFVWAKSFGGPGYNDIQDLEIASNEKSFYININSRGTDKGFQLGQNLINRSYNRSVIAKFDLDGNIISSPPNTPPVDLLITQLEDKILENSVFTGDLKVADLTIIDDGQGENNVSLSGKSSNLFVIKESSLYLSKDAELDFEQESSLEVNVTISDPAFSSDKSLTKSLSIEVLNQSEGTFDLITGIRSNSKGYITGRINGNNDLNVRTIDIEKLSFGLDIYSDLGTGSWSSGLATSQGNKKPLINYNDFNKDGFEDLLFKVDAALLGLNELDQDSNYAFLVDAVSNQDSTSMQILPAFA